MRPSAAGPVGGAPVVAGASAAAVRALHAAVAGVLALAGATAAAQPLVPLALECSGRAPQWRLDAGPELAVLRRADARPPEESFRGTLLRLVSPAWDGAAWRGAAAGAPARTLAVVVRREACTDGTDTAAGREGARGAVIPPDGPALAGCCRATFGFDLARAPLAEAAGKPPGDWSARLPALAGAVRACVTDSGVPVRLIASARPREGGGATVRLVDTAGAQHDCEVDGSRRRVLTTRAVADATPARAAADAPLLWPARERAPVIDCGRVERVTDRGATFGWLQYGPC
jgi:hypothetical protein